MCGVSFAQTQIAFSLSIFFLGLGAAFFGPYVEKDPGKAGFLAACFYLCGTALTGFALTLGNFPLLVVGYGVLNGVGQGVGYLAPVKALMLWFPKNRALAAAVPIVSFGLGSALTTALANWLVRHLGIGLFFFVVSVIYALAMAVGSLLLKKPSSINDGVKPTANRSCFGKIVSGRMFWHMWFFMFLNISAGLALIGCSAAVFKDAGFSQSTIVILMLLAGLSNGLFRLVFAWLSDLLKSRIAVWLVLSGLSMFILVCAGMSYPLVGAAVVLINATYGGGFSTCPAMISDCYSQNVISRTHGLVLSAWAFAGLAGSAISAAVVYFTGCFYWLVWVLVCMHALNFVNVFYARKTYSMFKEQNRGTV